ncbi:MAG TPA: DUF6064 family protein [Ferrovibrio sp.]|uniref:DUF6064 family protein n=1 Tax=Ferrovibrio sp. TaxID=1917215 RepID=UPI002B4ACBCC|nr:DUF6064 family protein [Ferrovibrio sp.]HLT79329.1 DUF6064 family protein [Ferrovibrio sp.]
MTEWWTYRLSDFLLFSPQTYYRLFELYNAAIWPMQVPALAAGLGILALLRRGGAAPGRTTGVLLGLGWLWTAWVYHRGWYAPINWAADYYAIGFAAQGALLLLSAAWPGRLAVASGLKRARTGWGIVVFAIVAHAMLPLLLGRPVLQAEVFGIAPDPTATATLGALLAMHLIRWELLVLPLLWCVITSLTLWTMDSPEAFVMPVIALLAILQAVRGKA